MLPEMSIAMASARSTCFLSCAAAGQASRRKRMLRRSSLAMATSAFGCSRRGEQEEKDAETDQLGHGNLRIRVLATRQELYRPSEAAVSHALDVLPHGPL